MKIIAEGYEFDFADAIAAFKFDEQDPSSPLFHGAPMKAVDIIAEFQDYYLFIEVKQYPESYDAEEDWGDKECSELDCPKRTKHKTWLKNYLKYKYRDTFLYRFAENKVDKPIRYLCLLDNFDNAALSNMRDNLHREIPLINRPQRWASEIISQCHCLNMNRWNTKYSQWPVRKVATP